MKCITLLLLVAGFSGEQNGVAEDTCFLNATSNMNLIQVIPSMHSELSGDHLQCVCFGGLFRLGVKSSYHVTTKDGVEEIPGFIKFFCVLIFIVLPLTLLQLFVNWLKSLGKPRQELIEMLKEKNKTEKEE